MKRYLIEKNKIGFVFKDGNLKKVITKAGKHTLWFNKMYVIERGEYLPPKDFTVSELNSLGNEGFASEYLISAGSVGALFVDGNFVKILQSGRHWFMTVDRIVDVKTMKHAGGYCILTDKKF